MSHLPLGGVSLNRLDYGAAVNIDPGRLERFCLVMMPISGVSEVQCGRDAIVSTPDLASVVSPTLPLRMKSHAGCDQMMVRIDRALIEHHCMHHLGRLLDRPLEFSLALDMTGERTGAWRRLMAYLMGEIANAGGALNSPLLLPHIEQMVVSTLLYCQPHSYTEELTRPAPSIAPHFICRAREYIRQNADRAVTVVDLAQLTGVSTRALYAGFQNFLGVSPMIYLKSVRLERVNNELKQASSTDDTVTGIALRWGFNHLGHFTSDYKRRFGELPSETLRRRQVQSGDAVMPAASDEDGRGDIGDCARELLRRPESRRTKPGHGR